MCYSRQNADLWRKAPKDGGISMPERRRYIADWISHGRKHLLENHLHEIWQRHQECGFVLACDGSEDDKLHFRDGKPFHLFNAFFVREKRFRHAKSPSIEEMQKSQATRA